MKGQRWLGVLLGLSAVAWLTGCATQRDEYLYDPYPYDSDWRDRHPFWERGQGHWGHSPADPAWHWESWENERWRY